MRMLSVGYIPEDCSSLLVCGAPGRHPCVLVRLDRSIIDPRRYRDCTNYAFIPLQLKFIFLTPPLEVWTLGLV